MACLPSPFSIPLLTPPSVPSTFTPILIPAHLKQAQQDELIHREEGHLEESHDEQLDRADFAQTCPKGHADGAHTEVRVDEAVGRQVREGPMGCGLSGQFPWVRMEDPVPAPGKETLRCPCSLGLRGREALVPHADRVGMAGPPVLEAR